MTERQITHFVGDDCPPDGHRGEYTAGMPPDYNSMGTTPYGGSRAAGPLLPYQTPMRCPTCGWKGRQEQCRIRRGFRYDVANQLGCPEGHPVVEDTEPPQQYGHPKTGIAHDLTTICRAAGWPVGREPEVARAAMARIYETVDKLADGIECSVCKMPILEGICENCCEERIMTEGENR